VVDSLDLPFACYLHAIKFSHWEDYDKHMIKWHHNRRLSRVPEEPVAKYRVSRKGKRAEVDFVDMKVVNGEDG